MATSAVAERARSRNRDEGELAQLWLTIAGSHAAALSFEAAAFDDQKGGAIAALTLNGVATNLRDALFVLEDAWPGLLRGAGDGPGAACQAPGSPAARALETQVRACVIATEEVLVTRGVGTSPKERRTLARCLAHLLEAHRLLCGRLP